MVAIIFLIVVAMALASNFSNVAMRIRLSRRLPSENGTSWWMRSSDDVGRTYQELFPESYLPSIVQRAFWLVVIAAVVVMLIVRWKSN
jgi:hypothetical protein